jgi:hypothetical protein
MRLVHAIGSLVALGNELLMHLLLRLLSLYIRSEERLLLLNLRLLHQMITAGSSVGLLVSLIHLLRGILRLNLLSLLGLNGLGVLGISVSLLGSYHGVLEYFC